MPTTSGGPPCRAANGNTGVVGVFTAPCCAAPVPLPSSHRWPSAASASPCDQPWASSAWCTPGPPYATAGLVTGGFAVVAGGGRAGTGPADRPLWPDLGAAARPAGSRRGGGHVARPWMPRAHPDWLMTAGGVLVGATIPQLGALSAARRAALPRDERPRRCPPRSRSKRWPTRWPTWPTRSWSASSATSGHPAASTRCSAGTMVVAACIVLCRAAPHRAAGSPGRPSATACGDVLGCCCGPDSRSWTSSGIWPSACSSAPCRSSVTAFRGFEHGAAGTAALLFDGVQAAPACRF